MSIWLDTRGNTSLAVAICGRCSKKYPVGELRPDPNAPGLYVCDYDRDLFDPWRLAPRPVEQIALRWSRPDTPLTNRDMVFYLTTENGFHIVTEDGASLIAEASERPIGQ